MPKTRQQKETIVKNLTEKLSRAKSVVFTNYQGLSMAELTALRSKLAELEAEFTITKNNLLKLALNNAKFQIHNTELFKGSIATLFAYEDEINPIKVLAKTLKETQKGEFKLGLFEGEVIDNQQILKLSNLPSKEELKAKTVGILAAPLHGIVGVLQANLRNLVYTVNQIRISKGGE